MRGDVLRLGERVPVDRGRVDVDPAHAEADARWPEPVRQREHADVAVACDRDAVQLERLVEALHDRLPLRRLGERGVQVAVELVLRADEKDAALAAGVRGLEDGREADGLAGGARAGEIARGGEARLRHARLGQRPAHRDLVSEAMRRLRPDPRQAERLRDGGDDGHGAVRRHRQHAVDLVPARDLPHRGDVGEVDRLSSIGLAEPERLGVPVDRDRTQAELLRPQDRAALVAAGADEQDAAH
jgi:hypothetical protein